MDGIFIWISYLDLFHQAWHLPFVAVSAFLTVCTVVFSGVHILNLSPLCRPEINAFLFYIFFCLLWWFVLQELPSLTVS